MVLEIVLTTIAQLLASGIDLFDRCSLRSPGQNLIHTKAKLVNTKLFALSSPARAANAPELKNGGIGSVSRESTSIP